MIMKRIIEKGLVVEYKGKYWGKKEGEYDGWTTIEEAYIAKKKYVTKPEDFAPPSLERELKKGKLIEVKRTTVIAHEFKKAK
ncbi:MAG: hypothetical protein WC026_13185 [Hyphomicrobium sp.]|uniref:hypothetical protein n=1 Tax=Hyphomicrobium sp. TaxID=82 RepID=UPI003562F7A6